MLQFLRDECKLRGRETTANSIETLSALFDWSLAHGFPVQDSKDLKSFGYRALEHRQKCAEAAMLVTLTSLWVAGYASDASNQADLLPIKTFAQSHQTASAMIDRLFRPGEMNYSIPAVLSGLILARSNLYMCRLHEADLRGAHLSRANLQSTDLSDCRMELTSLRSVDCACILNLSQQQVNAAFGVRSGVGLTLLPSHLSCPDHWYIAEDKDKDSRGDVEAYSQAWLALQNASRSKSVSSKVAPAHNAEELRVYRL